MLTAFVRPPGSSLSDCALTHLERTPIDVELATRQHRGYVRALAALGVAVRELPVLEECPDSCFVEDPALVLGEVAVILRPALDSRRGEVESVAAALREERELVHIETPATIEGGDILVVDETIYVGRTSRTNRAGVESLSELLHPFGYRVRSIEIPDCLHLKSAVTRIGPELLLANPDWMNTRQLGGIEVVEVDPTEPAAANVLRVGQTLLMPESYPRTREKLEARGLEVHVVDVSEFQKAEGAVTCLSLLFAGT